MKSNTTWTRQQENGLLTRWKIVVFSPQPKLRPQPGYWPQSIFCQSWRSSALESQAEWNGRACGMDGKHNTSAFRWRDGRTTSATEQTIQGMEDTVVAFLALKNLMTLTTAWPGSPLSVAMAVISWKQHRVEWQSISLRKHCTNHGTPHVICPTVHLVPLLCDSLLTLFRDTDWNLKSKFWEYCKTPLISTYVFSGLAMVQVLIFGGRTYFRGGGGMIRWSEKSSKEEVCSTLCFP